MALTNVEKSRLIRIYEPILFFHRDEKHVPVHPGDLMERSAMWCNQPVAKDRKSWGNCSHNTDDPFPRSPLIAEGALSVDPADAGSDERTFIGEATDTGFRTYLVSNEARELFLQTAENGWGASGPDTESDLSAEIYQEGVGILAGHPYYFADIRDQDTLGDIPTGPDTLIPPGFATAMQSLYPTGFWLLTFFFLYPYHEEALTDCEIDSEVVKAQRSGNPRARHLHGSYAGDWQAISVLVRNPGQPPDGQTTGLPPQPISPADLAEEDFPVPEFIGFSRRARGVFTQITSNQVDNRDFTFMPISSVAAGEVEMVDRHVKVFISRGTHNNYSTPGNHVAPKLDSSLPFGIEFFDACLAADNAATLLDRVEEVEEEVEEAKRVARIVAISLGKILGAAVVGALGGPAGVIVGAFLGGMAAVAEGLGGDGPDTAGVRPPSGPDDVPDVGPGGTEFGLVLSPLTLFDELSAALADQAMEVKPFNNIYIQKVVDRDSGRQMWWQPDGSHAVGYQGRWGVVCERDPFNRRSGTGIPFFEASFINALLTENG